MDWYDDELWDEKEDAIETEIAGIPSLIVDPHNEVFIAWAKYAVGQPAALIHIDAHPDMNEGAPTFELCTDIKDTVDYEDYAREDLTIGNFIMPAIHYGLVGVVYHVNPRLKTVDVYGSFEQGGMQSIATKVEKGIIKRDYGETPIGLRQPNMTITREKMITDLATFTGPLWVDTDLDGISCIHDNDHHFLSYHSHFTKLKLLEGERLALVDTILSQVRKPDLITIARSLHPFLFTPPDRVEYIQKAIEEQYATLYTN